jgi:hypothetical protein
MFKKIIIGIGTMVVIGLLIFGAVNRTQAKSDTATTQESSDEYRQLGDGDGNNDYDGNEDAYGYGNDTGNGGKGNGQEESNYLPAASGEELDDNEASALLYMREEEKLARDVYVKLYELWNLPAFQNINQSEQNHTETIKALLDRYGLNDPASSQEGVYTNPELQELYNVLVERGSQSMAEALKVGATIEEVDILDLQKYLSESDNEDIRQVFENLMNGSYNHLRAFVSVLFTQAGETYQPQYLDAAEYQTILDAETGGGYGNAGGQGGGYRGGRP